MPRARRRLVALLLVGVGLVATIGLLFAAVSNVKACDSPGRVWVIGTAIGATLAIAGVAMLMRLGPIRIKVSSLMLACVSLVFALSLAEVFVRLQGRYDKDGQFLFLDVPAQPYALPVQSLETSLRQSEGRLQNFVYDPLLGWSPTPDAVTRRGMYSINEAGLRSDVEYALTPDPETVRIAIFGDSFTFGWEVPLEDTWGYQLESSLRERGLQVEVLNFGVGNYGMDQAYLRWAYTGRLYSPDIVIFGFQPENMARNLNMIRPFYNQNSRGFHYSKPSLILLDDELGLLNSPAIPPEELPALVAEIDTWPLVHYEQLYDSSEYASRWWLRSRLVGVVLGMIDRATAKVHLSVEGPPLGVAIVDAFARDVERHDAEFIVAYIPNMSTFQCEERVDRLWYDDALNQLDERYNVVHSEDGMKLLSEEECFMPRGHYARACNSIVASRLEENIVAYLASRE